MLITFIKLLFCLVTKMATKMAATYQFTLVDTLFQSFITQFLPYMDYFYQTIVHVWIWVLSDEWLSTFSPKRISFRCRALGGVLCQSRTVLVCTVVFLAVGRPFLLPFTVFQSGDIDQPVFAGVRNLSTYTCIYIVNAFILWYTAEEHISRFLGYLSN